MNSRKLILVGTRITHQAIEDVSLVVHVIPLYRYSDVGQYQAQKAECIICTRVCGLCSLPRIAPAHLVRTPGKPLILRVTLGNFYVQTCLHAADGGCAGCRSVWYRVPTASMGNNHTMTGNTKVSISAGSTAVILIPGTKVY